MKKMFSLLIALCYLVITVHSQENYIRPKAIGFSFFFNDFTTANKIRTTSLNQVLSNKEFGELSGMNPGLAITYFKGIKPHMDIAATIGGSFLGYPFPSRTFTNDNFLLEANAAVNLKMTTEQYYVQPYISLGVGGHKYRSYYGAFMPLGLGIKVNLLDETHVFLLSTYRVPLTTETANYHFQHSLGIAGIIGKKKEPVIIPPPPPPPPADTDGDGIVDSLDRCPTVAGVVKYGGCPVPDTDKDGINDEEDKCPTVPGLARYQGCPIPDSDNDGINDEEDKCPSVAGVARYQGCPVPDSDGDGVNDEDDKCPQLKGTVENQGCPEITEEVKQKTEIAAKNILFITGSARLQSKSFKGLNDVVAIMKENPDMLLAIDGHTDNVGSDERNQVLSEQRANSVKNYLVSKGIEENRITATGYGESKPIADNNTAKGRQENRRSELTLTYYK
jgi:outer membrane protein OmpA-like peptidoglycan-associated protein